MKTFYCDGSRHAKVNVVAVGVIGGLRDKYSQIKNADLNNHEIEAIIRTIQLANSLGYKKFKVVNDDTSLILAINKSLSNKNFRNSYHDNERFNYLLQLASKCKITFESPKSEYDFKMIKKSHDLSRRYLNSPDYKHLRKGLNIKVNIKKPIELRVGEINNYTITPEQKGQMNLIYCALSKYNTKYTIDDVISWIENKPSSNTRNGRKYAVYQFVSKFCK